MGFRTVQKRKISSGNRKKQKLAKHVTPGYMKGKKDKRKKVFYIVAILCLAVGFGMLHMYHVATIFENDTHFSHLATLEREMVFRTEMGLYYSYYKTLIEAPKLTEGLYSITHDNLTEYPSTINTVQRFNLYPEIVASLLYRLYMSVMNYFELTTKQCWRVERGQNLPPVTSCEGLGDPMFFYLHIVWLMSGMTTMVIFAYGTLISGSVAGGFLSVLGFFFNHGECTRVQFTPPLRESFAYPLILWHMFTVTSYMTFLAQNISQTDNKQRNLISKVFKRSSLLLIIWLCGCTAAALVTWQFSQFIFATEVAAVFTIYALGVISKYTLVVIIFGQGVGVGVSIVALYGNMMLICSVYSCLLISVLVYMLVLEPLLIDTLVHPVIRPFISVLLVAVSTVFLKMAFSQWSENKDDVHILNLLLSKISDYKDFHTLLYTCSEEFDFLPSSTLRKLTSTLLIPAVILSLILVAIYWFHMFLGLDAGSIGKLNTDSIFPAILFNIIMLIPFTVMAVFIMRLKLFFSPHLCVLTSLLAYRKCFWFFRRPEMHWAFLVVFISGMSMTGLKNLSEQQSIVGDYSNIELEELLIWVNKSTSSTAVFAGPMSIMANLLLSTRRPIVNHPHYENAGLRQRTMKVYSAFSRKRPEEVYTILASMQVNYLVLEYSWCFQRPGKGCSLVDLWDIEDLKNRHRISVCPFLVVKDPAPFQKVFINDKYVVLHLGARYVELTMAQYKM